MTDPQTPTYELCKERWIVGACTHPFQERHMCCLRPHDEDRTHVCTCGVEWGGMHGERPTGEVTVTSTRYGREPVELKLRRPGGSMVLSMTSEESVLVRQALEAHEKATRCWCGGELDKDSGGCTSNVWHAKEEG